MTSPKKFSLGAGSGIKPFFFSNFLLVYLIKMLHNYNYFFFLYIPAPPLFLQLLPELLVSSSLHIDLLWLQLPASLAVRSLLLRPSLLCSRLGFLLLPLVGLAVPLL